LSNHKKVIPFPVSPWRFFDYADDIEDWYYGLSEEGQDIFEDLLKVNSKVHLPLNWLGCEMLQGACAEQGIWEWKFRADNVQQRLLGVFGEERRTAIFLIACIHKQKIYKPPDCLETAINRAKNIQKGEKFRERKIRENL
jgi:hypothetical protein